MTNRPDEEADVRLAPYTSRSGEKTMAAYFSTAMEMQHGGLAIDARRWDCALVVQRPYTVHTEDGATLSKLPRVVVYANPLIDRASAKARHASAWWVVGNEPPRDWLLCDGSVISSREQAFLFLRQFIAP